MSLSIDKKIIADFRTHILSAKNIAILSHVNPDGDAVGSLLATQMILSKVAVNANSVQSILPNACPETFRYLPGSDQILDADYNLDRCKKCIEMADLILCVDLNNSPRVGILQPCLEASAAPKLLVDHHQQPDTNMFQFIVSDPEISSASELSYWLAVQMWGKDVLDEKIATCLYTGICTDTGSFAYSCDSPSLYEAVAGLMQFEINGADIHNRLFNTFSVNRMRLLGFCISERLRIFESEKFAYFYVSLQDQKHFGIQPGDLEVIVNYTLMMKNIEVGAFIKQTDDGTVRISLRSKYNFDVNLFARTYFCGGGHKKAAGATSPYGFDETVQKVESLLRTELSKYNQ